MLTTSVAASTSGDVEPARQPDVLAELRALPRDSSGQIEIWRQQLTSGAPWHEVMENLEQERKLLLVRETQHERELEPTGYRDEFSDEEERRAEVELRGCREQLRRIEKEIVCRLSDQLYPELPPLRQWPDHDDFAFDAQTEFMGMRAMVEISKHFSDEGFVEDGSILADMWKRLGYFGTYNFVQALRHRHMPLIEKCCAQITAQSKKERGALGPEPCHDRLRPFRKIDGSIVIVIDQPGNDEYVPPFISGLIRTNATNTALRLRGRSRSSKGKPSSLRRRAQASAHQGGDPPDDDGDGSDPPGLLGGQLHSPSVARRWGTDSPSKPALLSGRRDSQRTGARFGG